MNEWEIGGRLFVAALLGGFIGLERESHGRPAGLRTHVLVSLGSCLIMLISIYGFAQTGKNYDPGRLAAQVISGIGFLGAGTILREGISIRGLTTAASLWCVSGIGLAIGCGYYIGASVATVLSVTTLVILEYFEKNYLSPKASSVEMTFENKPGELANICSALEELKIPIHNMEVDLQEGTRLIHITVTVENKNHSRDALLEILKNIPGIVKIRCK